MEIIKDLILTDCFLIKGFIETGGMRLSDYLDNLKRSYIPVQSVTMVDLEQGRAVSAHEALVRREEIIVAHEFLDVSGDRNMRNLMDERAFSQTVDLYHTGGIGIEVSGRMRSGAYEAMDKEKNFFVILEARIRGLDTSINPELKLLDTLPYAIVNRKRIGYIFKS